MAILKGDIQTDGALVHVRCGWGRADVQAQRQALRPIPPPVDARALLDSGADVTCLDSALIQMLGLLPGIPLLANVPVSGGLTITLPYRAGLVLVHPSGDPAQDLVLPDHPVLELTLGPLGYQALIGRDILNRCRFLFDGPRGKFLLAY